MVSIYNSGKWIDNRLKNIFNSTIIDKCEVVCVNANSPDPLDDEIPKKYPCSYIKLDSDLSLYDTWNMIIKDSKTEYLTNANTDDIVAPTAYEQLSQILKQEQLACVYPSWHTTSIDNLTWEDTKDRNKCHINGGQPGQFAGNISQASPGHFPMWKKSLHYQVGYFDPSFTALADAHFWTKVWYGTNYGFWWHREPLGCYLWRNGENLWNRKISSEQWQKFHEDVARIRAESRRIN